MSNLKFADTHNMVVFLSKPVESKGFEQIVDFLNAHPIRYALTVNPTIYRSCIKQFWSSAVAKTINREVQLNALVDGKRIVITETSVRRTLRLADAEGSGPRCQETIEDNIAQTKFENVSTQSYDLLLARGNTLRSGEDSLKLTELMELCTNLQTKVLDLEKKKTTQANEIASLKRRVKKLEKKRSSRTHKLKRLYKVSLSARVESFIDEQSLGKDASKYGRINAIDADEDITLVSVHDMNMTADEEVVRGILWCWLITVSVLLNYCTTVKEITLAQALESLKTTKPKQKGVVIQELDESTTTRTISSQKSHDKIAREKAEKEYEANIALTEVWDDIQAKIKADHELAKRQQAEEQEQFTIEQKSILFKELLEQRRKHFATKRSEEKRNKPPTQAQQRKIIAFKRVNTFVNFRTNLVEDSSKRAGEKLEQESTKKQKVDEDKDISELQSLMKVILDEEEVAIDVVPLATKPPTIVDWKIHKEGKNGYFKIIRADRSLKMYLVFSHMLKSFDREDLETLWKLVKAKDSLTPLQFTDMLNKKLHVDYLVKWHISFLNFLQNSLRIKEVFGSILLTAGEVTTVSTKLLLLEEVTTARRSYYFNAAEGVNAASEEVSTAELVMAAPIISISSNSSEESVGSHAPRVILFVLFLYYPCYPRRFLIIPAGLIVARMIFHVVSPFLCFDDSEADSESEPAEQRPRFLSTGRDILRRTYHTHSNGPRRLLTTRKRVRPVPARRLAWRRVSHHSLDRHSSPDSSSSSSPSDHSLSRHTPPDTTDADTSTPPRFVHRSFARTPRRSSSERTLDSSSPYSGPSRKRSRSSTASVPSPTHVLRLIAPTPADLLPPQKRFRDSYLLEDSGEEHMEVDTADVEAVADIGISDGVVAHTEDGVGMRVEIAASDVREDDEEFEAEASAADTREIVVDPLAIGDSSESSRGGIPDLEDTIYDIVYYMSEVRIDRITEIETTQRQLETSQLVASGERASLVERIGSLRLEYLKVRAMLSIERDRVDSIRWHMALSQEEFRQVRRDRDDTRRRLRRLESYVERHLGFRTSSTMIM
ncbi:hypothetical protein Tco_0895573 [Tanacetum coccineum]|uniref:Xylulose kinase-1 n=1 Tax=Tanacetum coccineum TaxID=301880 RepID=A0ABQ5CIE4_9ASTR